ncbi:hypothetical protein EST38_g12632 [Candolleomyces aberdarensis]|uniref:SET domain-containing protein n=1 Tax=Candolleomyces aberdarensis TaxID=2316362 RepID=A0A4Q2D2P5_9AGAR|nr:hypothetical protein EST38_g12632 [Candolleomyces aberdarensis]
MEITPGPQPGSSRLSGSAPATPTVDDDAIVKGDAKIEDMLPKDWETLSIAERIRRATDMYGQGDREGKVKAKHAAFFGSIASVLFRNAVPGSKSGKPLESPHDFGIMVREWKKCIDDGNKEVVKAATSGTGHEDDGAGGNFGGAVVAIYRLASELGAGGLEEVGRATRSLPSAMLFLEEMRRSMGNQKDDSDEEEAEVEEGDGKGLRSSRSSSAEVAHVSQSTGKAKRIVAQSSRATHNGARLVKLPFGSVEQEELPDDIDNYVTPMKIGPVDKAPLQIKNGKVVQPAVIATYVPPCPLDDSESDPDGHTIWMTTPVTKAKYFSNKGWPKPLPKIPNKIVVRPTDDGTGMGVFATRDIKRFEPVLVERPYMIYSRKAVINTFSQKALEELSDNQIAQLLAKESEPLYRYMVDQQMTSEAKRGFMSLANSHTDDGSGLIFGIVRTNGFGIDFGGVLPGADEDFGLGYGAVGKTASRFNHSCIPDVSHAFDVSTFTMRFYAVRDIKKGSQIYVTYTSLNATKAERQKALAPYGFECICRACVKATPQSDKLRQVSHTLTQKWRSQAINVWSKDPNLTEKVLIPILETKRRMEEEGLDTEEAGYLTFPEILFRVYQKVGNRAKMEEAKSELLRVGKALAKVQEWTTGVKLKF